MPLHASDAVIGYLATPRHWKPASVVVVAFAAVASIAVARCRTVSAVPRVAFGVDALAVAERVAWPTNTIAFDAVLAGRTLYAASTAIVRIEFGVRTCVERAARFGVQRTLSLMHISEPRDS